MNSLNELAKEIHQIAVEHGWWPTRNPSITDERSIRPEDRNFGEQIALMHSELSEALESWRKKERAWFTLPSRPDESKAYKPEGWAVELVDCMIRILDTLSAHNINVDAIMRKKMDYNKDRPYRHGNKRA